jgi:hypothetical protein
MRLSLITGFIELLQMAITNNYSAIAISHTLQFTRAHIKSLDVLYLHQCRVIPRSKSRKTAPNSLK